MDGVEFRDFYFDIIGKELVYIVFFVERELIINYFL